MHSANHTGIKDLGDKTKNTESSQINVTDQPDFVFLLVL